MNLRYRVNCRNSDWTAAFCDVLYRVKNHPCTGKTHMLGENLEGLYESRPRMVPGGQNLFQDTRSAARILPSPIQVVLRPSNSSQRHERELMGVCKNLSQSGCAVVAEAPARVGDIYRFEVRSESTHPIHGAHARCVRCHLLDEDLFEFGFAFLSPVHLETVAETRSLENDPLS